MATEYAKYIASALTDNQIVTYRLLSRALKVHHSEAKRMLYEFHRQQNERKPGSVHATYLVTGIQVPEAPAEASQNTHVDSLAPSSPYMSSFAVPPEAVDEVVPVPQCVLTLVKEESLDSAKARYESISSIHVYSLEPNTLNNLEMLSAVTQKIMTEYISEDPLIHNKTYGVIQNASVKRRAGARPPPKPLPVKEETKSAFAKSQEPKTSEATKTLSKPKEAPPGSGEQATKVGAPGLIKRENSDLVNMFAKAKPKAKATSTKPSKLNEDTTMKDASDGGSDEDVDLSAKEDAAFAARRAKRREEEEKRRRLLEDDDEDEDSMQDVKPSNPASDIDTDAKVQPESSRDASSEHDSEAEADDTPSAPIDAPVLKQEEPEEQPTAVVSGGRRRGRRKKMDKKRTRDADGNIVTEEVEVWESFSEDEKPPPTLIKSKSASSTAAKAKKAAGKPGQGSIMNFFGKK